MLSIILLQIQTYRSDADLQCLSLFQDMDTSNPSVFVNAELLRMHVGKKVRAVVHITQSDGEITTGKSTDEHQLIVKGLPHVSLMSYVEVIGIAETDQSIRAETWTNFGNTFGMNNLQLSLVFLLLLIYSLHSYL